MAVFPVGIAIMLGFAEIGYRLGLRLHATNDVARNDRSAVSRALGLLDLLLGFTFAMTVIGTTHTGRLVVRKRTLTLAGGL